MSADVRSVVESMLTIPLEGNEVVTIGPREVEVEFPLADQLAERLYGWNHPRPAGCRDIYIYGLRGPDKRYFYVGSTVRSLAKRLQEHKTAALKGANTNKRLVRRLLELADQVEIDLVDTVPESQRFVREYETINELLAKGIKLLNSQLAPRYAPRYMYPKAATK
jgi:hypothetical protein